MECQTGPYTAEEIEVIDTAASAFIERSSSDNKFNRYIEHARRMQPTASPSSIIRRALDEWYAPFNACSRRTLSKEKKELEKEAYRYVDSWRNCWNTAVQGYRSSQPLPVVPEPKRSALNAAAAAWLKQHPQAASAWLDAESSRIGYELFHRLDRALEMLVDRARRDVPRNRPPQYKVANLKGAELLRQSWNEMRIETLRNLPS